MSTLCVVHVREVRNWNCVTQEYSPPPKCQHCRRETVAGNPKHPTCCVPAASVGVSSSYSSSGVYLGEDSSGGGELGLRYGEGYGSGSGGGGGSGSYVVSSVSKVRSSSSGGARRAQGAGSSSGGVSPGFRERKVVSSRSGGYDGECWLQLRLKKRKQP